MMCHGPAGRGDGPKAMELHLRPRDLTSERLAAESDGEIYWKITTGHSPMPTFQKMLSEDARWHVVNYVRTLGPAPVPENAQPAAQTVKGDPPASGASAAGDKSTANPGSVAHGKQLYESHCASCHGPQGKGDGPRGKDLDPAPSDLSAAKVAAKSDAKLLAMVINGRKPMPSFQKELSEQDQRNVVAFIRTFNPGGRPKGAEAAINENAARGTATSAQVAGNQAPATRAVDGSGSEEEEKQREPNHFVRWIGHFHPPLTAFPIALLLTAAMAELLRLMKGPAWLEGASRWCIIIGAGSAVVTAPLGWAFATERAASWILEVHRWLGTTAAAGAVILLILSEIARRRPGCWLIVFRIVLFAAVPLIAATGFFGGAMVYGLHAYQWNS